MMATYDPSAPLPAAEVALSAAAGAGRTHTLATVAGRLVEAGHAPGAVLLVAPRRHGIRALRAALPAAAAGASLLTVDDLALQLATRWGLLLGLVGVRRLSPAADEDTARAVLADFWARTVAPSRRSHDRLRQLGRVDLDDVARRAALAGAAPDARLEPEGEQRALEGLTRAVCQEVRRVGPARRAKAGCPTAAEVWTAVADAARDPDRAAPLRSALRATWTAALIDDAHDLDPAAVPALRALFDGAPLWWSHDPGQALAPSAAARLRGRPALPTTTLTLGPARRAQPALAAALAGLFDPQRIGEVLGPQVALPSPPGPHPEALVVRWLPSLGAAAAPDAAQALALASAACADAVQAALLEAPAPEQVAVVVQTHAQARAVQAVLRRRGVRAGRVGGRSVLHTATADDLAVWLAALAAPSPRVLRAALATDLGGHDAHELAALQQDEAGWSRWLDTARRLGDVWRTDGVLPAIQGLRAALDLPKRWLRRPEAPRLLTDLRHLAERLHTEAAARALRPAALLAWFEAVRADPDPPLAGLRAEQGAGAVRILTAGRARDGAFHTVVAPFFWTAPSDDGLAVGADGGGPAIDLRGRRDRPAAWRRAVTQERLVFGRRALYVALTRATHRAELLWGRLPDAERSPLASLLHPQPIWPDKIAGHLERLDDAGWRAELAELDALPGVAVVDHAPQAPPSAPPAPAQVPPARAFERAPLDLQWGRTSFSGLTRDAPHASHAGADEPEPTLDLGLTPPPERPLLMATVPPGAVTGTCAHGILEEWDFQDPAALPEACAAGLARHGLPAGWAPALAAGLGAAAQVPLTGLGGLRLADVPRTARLDELAFVLPVDAPINGARLAQVMGDHPGPGLPPGYREHLAALPAQPVRGFLSGSIDLTCRHDGRWYAMDYKTNRLGQGATDYTPQRVERAMVDGHYVLQAHLYAVALHRFLTVRLGTAYDPDAHLGGLAWLFLRGMHPDHPPGTGIWAHTPPVARIQALSACLGAPPVPQPAPGVAAQLDLGLL